MPTLERSQAAAEKGLYTIAETSDSGANGLYVLFATGKRPDRAAVRDFVASQRMVSLTHDPTEDLPVHLAASDGRQLRQGEGNHVRDTECIWVELLRDGLMFDLIGLAEGSAVGFPKIERQFDLGEALGPARYEALQLVPGHHLTGGERTMPVVKGLMALARDLVHHFDEIEAVFWPPSASAIGRRFFESVSTAWLDGGAFPALGLTAFRETTDGALQSVGLDFWIDQELRIEPPLSIDKISATRLGVRLINQLVLVGGIEGSERIVAPDGNLLVMRTSRNGKFIRVWRE